MSFARNRSRAAVALDCLGVSETLNYNSSLIKTNHPRLLQNSSHLADESHPIWNLKDSSGRSNPYIGMSDVGGPMDHTSVTYDVPQYGSGISQGYGFIWKRYTGPVSAYFLYSVPDYQSVPMTASEIISRIPESIDSLPSRFGQGGTAISRCAPARPEAALSISVIEILKDGIPNMLSEVALSRNNIERFHSMGKDYLNAEFGWRPFIDDYRKMLQSIANQERILEDLSRNSGKRLRRRYEFEGITNTEKVADSFTPWPFAGGQLDLCIQASHHRTTTSTKKTWFAGEFVYRVPQLHGIGGVGAQARHLLGLDLTPATLYNATPWTWFADWFANVGDVLANVSAMSADDLVMRYGYLMQETKMVVKSEHFGVMPQGISAGIPTNISGSATFKRQTRIAASPFGFGLTPLDFSPRQWAVLAALGISKGR